MCTTTNASQVTAGLSTRWITPDIAVKPYAAMAALHAGIDAALALRSQKQIDPKDIKSILIEVGDAAFAHGGFPIEKPIAPITAQMSLRYSIAVALLDGAALIKQFAHSRLNSDDVWELVQKTDVRKNASFNQKPHTTYTTQITLTFCDGSQRQQIVEAPTGGEGHALTNDAIAKKFNDLSAGIAARDRMDRLQSFVVNLEKSRQAVEVLDLLEEEVSNALA